MREQPHKNTDKEHGELTATIKKRVLQRLDKPKNLYMIKAINVFNNKWRINIYTSIRPSGFVGLAPAYEIADSFFCEWTNGGRLKCNPPIQKKY